MVLLDHNLTSILNTIEIKVFENYLLKYVRMLHVKTVHLKNILKLY